MKTPAQHPAITMKNHQSFHAWLTVGSLFAGAILAVQSAPAATDTWNSGGADNNWATGGNWTSGLTPSPGDALVFGSGVHTTPTNNFTAGTLFDGITFNSGSPAFTLVGNSVLLSGNTNNITTGITNGTSLAQTVSNNLALDWGYHTFYSQASGSSLNLDGTLTANLGGAADFGTNNVTSASLVLDGTGLIAGLGGAGLVGNTGLGANSGGGFSALATLNNGVVTNYTYTGNTIIATAGAIGATTQANATNLEITAATGNFSLAGGTSSTYGTSQTFINTVLLTINGTTKVTTLVVPSGNGTLVLGTTNAGTGMYVGGIYLPGGQTAQEITVGGGTSTFLTAGPMTGGNPVPGEIIIAVNGDNTSNEGEMNAVIKDNLSGGKVSVVYTGGGSLYINNTGNTYSGGTYMIKGRLQCNQLTALGTGPVYISGGDAEISLQNVPVGTMTNSFFLSPGCSSVEAATEGSLRLSGTAGAEFLTNTITLMGNPITPGATAGTTSATIGDRISASTTTALTTMAGQITGSGTLEFFANANGITFLLSNVTANANNWTGGLILDSGNNDNSDLKIMASNQLGGNNVTLIQAGTGFARLDLDGFNDTIGGLNSSGSSALNQVADFGTAPSTLTLGTGNATATFGGVIGGDSAPDSLAIIKVGTGTQTLTGANTYTGNTLVEGGTLALTGSGAIGGSPQITVSNATFDVSALSAYGGSSSIGMMSNSTFNVGNVLATVSGGLATSNSTLVFPLNESSANITVSGILATGGATNVINLTSVPGFGSYPQQFPLIKYGSADPNLVDINNNLTSLGVILPVQGGLAGYLTNNTGNSSIDLVLTTGPIIPVEPITWRGQTNGVNTGSWDILTTSNWVLTADGVTPYFYQDTSPVTFDDTVTGTTNVVLTRTLLPGSVTFNNTNTIYTLSGSGKISGTTAWTNNGTGTVKLTESGGDNFSGGITVNSGTLVIDDNSGGISGGLTLNAGTVQVGNNDAHGVLPSGTLTDDGALVFNRSDTALNVGTVISGTGTLANNGTGTVTLSAIETYTGPTVANAGTLVFTTPNANPSGISASSSLTINSGATVEGTLDNAIGLTPATLPVTINAGGTLTGAATADSGGGTSSHIGGVLTLNGGTLTDGGSQTPNLTYGTWDLDGGVTVPGTNITSTINCLNVVPSQTSGTLFNVTNGTTPSGIDLLVSGTFIDGTTHHDTGIIKNGPGVMVLDANNGYSAGTTINDGILQLGLASDAAALTTPVGTTNEVTINTGGILKFASSKGVTVTNVIADDGTGIVLINSGTNTLTAVNTYSGNTLVLGATLALTGFGSINSSASITVSNATLDVSTSASTVDSTGSLSLTNSTFNLGTNLVTSLGSLGSSNSTLIFPVNGSTPNISLTGALTSGGTTNVINITAVPGFLYYPTNLHLIAYGSFANVDGGNNLTNLGLILPVLGSPAGYLTNNAGNSSIDLVVLSDTLTPIFPITWSGRTNGVNTGSWDILTTPDWVFTSDGVTPYKYQDTSAVTFDDTAAGTTAVNLTTTVSPGSLIVSNASKTYTFSGTGKISGNTGLVKLNSGTATFAETGGDNFNSGVTVGGGTLILSNANVNISGGMTVNGGSLIDEHSGTFTGNLDLNGGLALLDQSGSISGNLNITAGTVQVGNNDANGNLPSGAITDGDTLIFDRSDSALNVGGVISGGGTLVNNGTGTVTLGAIETLTGPVVVNAGTLAVSESVNGNPDGISASSGLTINTNGTFMFESDNAGFGTAASGSVPVTINAGGTLTGLGSADGGDGTSSHIPNLLTLNGGTLAMQGPPAALPSHGSWDLYGGVAVNTGPNYLTTSTISALGVIPTQSGGTRFDVTPSPGGTPSGIDLLISGSLIDGTAGGVFVGSGIIVNPNSETGVMALDNNNTFLGGVTIDGGTLQLGTASDTAALASPLGAGTVSINNSGTILKFGSSQGVTVTNVISDDNLGDTLVLVSSGNNFLNAANLYTAPTVISNGTLVINGSLAAASTVTVNAGTHATLAGAGTVGGNVTNNGTITPGTTTTIGLLTCSANVTNSGASTSLLKLNTSVSPSNDVLAVTGALAYGGTLKVLNLGVAFAAGDSFQLFTAGTISGTFSATNLPAAGAGLGWNWNPATGTLSVIQVVNTNAATANFKAALAGGSLQFSWASDHLGWQLYTNAVSLTATGSWFPVPGSAAVTSETITINPANPNVFFQLRFP
jgi:fibronectin-binding autotransporter adhesin